MRTRPTDTHLEDNVPLLTDVIFQANDDIGDIWLQQDTVDQSIATASQASVARNQGVGFAAGGSIGDVHIQGSKGFGRRRPRRRNPLRGPRS